MARLSRLVRPALLRRSGRLPPGAHPPGDRPDRGRCLWRRDPACLATPACGGSEAQVVADRLRATCVRAAVASRRSGVRRPRLGFLVIAALPLTDVEVRAPAR